MPTYTYDSDDEMPKLFGRKKPLHHLFGGGTVADAVLWRNKQLSAGILAGATVIWLLFEVVEYHFLTLLCHISIAAMLFVFIWFNGAALFDRTPPEIPQVVLVEQAFRETAFVFLARLDQFVKYLFKVAREKDLKMFLLAIASLWIVSIIGSNCSSISLLYFGFASALTIPALYERYEGDVDHLVMKAVHDLKKQFNKFDSKVLDKIPRGPVKERKFK